MSDDAPRVPAVLSIAGSDSGGGAGIQADLKAFAAAGVHGMTAITALTAQNTVAVEMIEAVSPRMIVAQIAAVAGDIGVDAVKVGMLGDATTIAAVAEGLDLVGDVPVVVDPVMVSESGGVLLDPDARSALVEQIVPRATVLTPNLAEARVLAAAPEAVEPEGLARAIIELGPGAVIVTGGHGDGVDLLLESGADAAPMPIAGELYPDGAAHGSGCTHSSTLAALLARGAPLASAATEARAAAGRAVRDGLRGIGSGPGPVDVIGVGGRAVG